jgi:hypothetical protein
MSLHGAHCPTCTLPIVMTELEIVCDDVPEADVAMCAFCGGETSRRLLAAQSFPM